MATSKGVTYLELLEDHINFLISNIPEQNHNRLNEESFYVVAPVKEFLNDRFLDQ